MKHTIALLVVMCLYVAGESPDDHNCAGHNDRIQEAMLFADHLSHHESCTVDKKVVEVISVDGRDLSYEPDHGIDGKGIPLDVDTINAGYYVMNAVINYLYAKRHGYNYRYIHLKLHEKMSEKILSEDDMVKLADQSKKNKSQANKHPMEKLQYCNHPLHGHRSAPWCKLLGVFDRVKHKTADEILFLDTDAFVVDTNRTLESALEENATLDSASPRDAKFIVPTHFPFFQGMIKVFNKCGIKCTPMIPACSAVMMFRPCAISEWMLLEWWNTADFPQWKFDFPFEQGTLEYGLLRHDHFRQNHASIINWTILDFKDEETFIPQNYDTTYIAHVGSGGYNSRTRKFAPMKKLRELGVTDSKQFEELVKKVRAESELTPSLERLEEQIAIPVPNIRVSLPVDCCMHHKNLRKYYCPHQVCQGDHK
eukprot:m.117635 g.117635  ORF g.117635 m.117635 type:complete len:424 (-) comp28592_c0_seq2:147-1418(-)